MNILRQILFTTLTTFFVSLSYGQSDTFKTYKYEHNDNYTKLNFSFDIPSNWSINPETVDGTGYFLICTPTSESEIAKYSDCFGGTPFRLIYRNGNLDTVLTQMGLQKKSDGMYLTTFNGKIKIQITTNIKGENYNGLYYTITDQVVCTDKKKRKIAAKYQFIYFSNGSQTIIVETNGAKLDDLVFKKLIDTFTFN
ncbi:MAG: hypothetical protein POELPBGB_01991 [Bacteroidia bacterium]|nr:hypothetical protein [Bacteroidia bacterium]